MLDIKMVPERHNKVKVLLLMDVGGTMDEHIHRVEELFSAAKTEFKHLEFYYFHNCVYDFMWKNNRRRFSEKFATWDVIRKYNKDYKLIFVGDATMSPYEILQPGGSVEYNNEEAGAEWLQRLTQRLPEVRLDQPRAAGRLAVPAEHRDRPAADEPAHVPADAGRARRRDAAAGQMSRAAQRCRRGRRRCAVRGCALLAGCAQLPRPRHVARRPPAAARGGAASARPRRHRARRAGRGRRAGAAEAAARTPPRPRRAWPASRRRATSTTPSGRGWSTPRRRRCASCCRPRAISTPRSSVDARAGRAPAARRVRLHGRARAAQRASRASR